MMVLILSLYKSIRFMPSCVHTCQCLFIVHPSVFSNVYLYELFPLPRQNDVCSSKINGKDNQFLHNFLMIWRCLNLKKENNSIEHGKFQICCNIEILNSLLDKYMFFSHYIACKWTIFISLQGNRLTGK